MDEARQRVDELFDQVRDTPPADRLRRLREICDDASLIAAVLERFSPDSSSDFDTTAPVDDGRRPEDASTVELHGLRRDASYEPLGELARGGMGAIHQIKDTTLGRTLAMKVLLDGEHAEAGMLARFLEEAKVTAQLDHPGIVPVHELGVDDRGRVYFTMKLVKGEDLRHVLRKVDRQEDGWNLTRALNVVLRACEAMAFAHDKGVIHRDLKPANVMVGRFGEVYVMDWGLARVVCADDPDATSSQIASTARSTGDTSASPIVTQEGQIVGTPATMAPEQAEGRRDEIGPHTDVYAMGAILYRILTGSMPYLDPDSPRMTPRAVLDRVAAGPPEAVVARNPDAPAELVAICDKAMSRRISDRYRDMTALARDLRAYLEDRVVTAHATGTWAELRKWISRNRVVATVAAAALGAVLLFSLWAMVERQRAIENEAAASRHAARADQNARTAERRADDLLRLSDARRLTELIDEIDELLPPYPDRRADMIAWLERADALLSNLPTHEATLLELRARGTPTDPPPPSPMVTAMEKRLETQRSAPDDQRDAELIAGLEAALEELRRKDDARREQERDPDFGDDVDARWWHGAVHDLVRALRRFGSDDSYGDTVASVRRHLEFADGVVERTMTSTQAATAWAEARAEIARDPRYGGLELAPQIGLLPLGADAESGLWEFWHVMSGARPERDGASGRWRVTGDTGIVLVLIPGGTYTLGAQAEDPERPNYDPLAVSDETPYKETLAPFFLSKYELTQAQWERLTGDNPSSFSAQTFGPDRPIENVSFSECRDVLRGAGLLLPTESEWEVGCRGGKDTTWSFGRDPSAFPRHGNVRDVTYSRRFAATHPASCDAFDDGQGEPSPVGTYEPNGYGLHDVHGNVWEWCRGSPLFGGLDAAAELTLRGDEVAGGCFNRGGCYSHVAVIARTAYRINNPPDTRGDSFGVRPARVVE